MKKVQRLSREVAFENEPFMTLYADQVEFPTGAKGLYTVVDRPDFVMIVPIDSEGNTYLVKQHRYPIDDSPLEFAAGRVDPGEDMYDAAKRELREELGLEAESLVHVGSAWVSTGVATNKGHYFFAQNITNLGKQELDETESIDIIKVAYSDLDSMIEGEKVNDQHVLGAKYYVDRYLNNKDITI